MDQIDVPIQFTLPADLDWDTESKQVAALVQSWSTAKAERRPGPVSSWFPAPPNTPPSAVTRDLVVWAKVPAAAPDHAALPRILVTRHSEVCGQLVLVIRPDNPWQRLAATATPPSVDGLVALADMPADLVVYVAAPTPDALAALVCHRSTGEIQSSWHQAQATKALGRLASDPSKYAALAKTLHVHRLTAELDLHVDTSRADLTLIGLQYNTVAYRPVPEHEVAQFSAVFGLRSMPWTTFDSIDAAWSEFCVRGAPETGTCPVILRTPKTTYQSAWTVVHGMYAAWRAIVAREHLTRSRFPRAHADHWLVRAFRAWFNESAPASATDLATLVAAFLASIDMAPSDLPTAAAGADRTVLIPVAVPGSGKTTLARALTQLAPSSIAVIQNDLVGPRSRRGGSFSASVTASLAQFPIVFADRNNHLRDQRITLAQDVRTVYPAARMLYLVWPVARADRDRIVRALTARITRRGESHPTLSSKRVGPRLGSIVANFVNSRDEVDRAEIGEVATGIDWDALGVEKRVGAAAVFCDVFAAPERNLMAAWRGIVRYADAARGWDDDGEMTENEAKEVVAWVMQWEEHLAEQERVAAAAGGS
ncbi:hypothetical protein AMAG_09250 [Allomyces macrogynus ATCC 38327]|uniref:tRNA ligase kinase domain-containing protein n=1 Tax=Allomyces macrogynus (strain ATCC 38327) TaxID=578462 RepID=A0A0L0SNY6_ALLM3|nr:hypothetical protein AMAG_09250 [Allomyces macrogynus ATCC 38327]|eukprot:KNE64207.1 hypothetical protein AMAG_09250 [Allomyces macrogynus ATCC 38327]